MISVVCVCACLFKGENMNDAYLKHNSNKIFNLDIFSQVAQ